MKKAEIQIQETILVIFIITIIISAGLVVFYQYNKNSVDQAKLEYEQEKVYSLLATLPNNPSLQYSSLGNAENAIDTAKLLQINLGSLGDKEITIKQIYPNSQEKICIIANYPDCNTYKIYVKKPGNIKNTNIISTPVSLYYPLTKEYKPGILEIKWHY